MRLQGLEKVSLNAAMMSFCQDLFQARRLAHFLAENLSLIGKFMLVFLPSFPYRIM
jgi:hypothetical protein